MIRSTRDFWKFHAIFWTLAALALFAYGLTYGHAQVAFVRNIYSAIVGFACSFLIRAVYENHLPASTVPRLLMIAGLSSLGALVSALVVNPITYGLLGYDIGNLPPVNLLQDGLYFVLLYVLWSVLYLQLTGRTLVVVAGSDSESAGMGPISVSKGAQVLKLDPANITCVKASGDYVELCTAEDSYLKHGTISSFEQALAGGPFVRVHRSVLVNRDRIQSVTGPSKGQFWIHLDDGSEVRSSRGYQGNVETLIPEAR